MDNTVAGLACLEKALELEDNKGWYSYLGYCIAKERGQVSRGVELCMVSLEHEPENPEHYLNLGKVKLISGNKADALRFFREGITKGGSVELRDFGMRKPPVLRFLARSNPLNIVFGRLFCRIGFR
ncbi:MAG TPA: hypothetical protein PLI53_05745 [Geobacteraceae bacterium]|nr:hypothetical protein [Geobacteraceae bacterium]